MFWKNSSISFRRSEVTSSGKGCWRLKSEVLKTRGSEWTVQKLRTWRSEDPVRSWLWRPKRLSVWRPEVLRNGPEDEVAKVEGSKLPSDADQVASRESMRSIPKISSQLGAGSCHHQSTKAMYYSDKPHLPTLSQQQAMEIPLLPSNSNIILQWIHLNQLEYLKGWRRRKLLRELHTRDTQAEIEQSLHCTKMWFYNQLSRSIIM